MIGLSRPAPVQPLKIIGFHIILYLNKCTTSFIHKNIECPGNDILAKEKDRSQTYSIKADLIQVSCLIASTN